MIAAVVYAPLNYSVIEVNGDRGTETHLLPRPAARSAKSFPFIVRTSMLGALHG